MSSTRPKILSWAVSSRSEVDALSQSQILEARSGISRLHPSNLSSEPGHKLLLYDMAYIID